MRSFQDMVDLVDQVPFDQVQDGVIYGLSEEVFTIWTVESETIYARGGELGCQGDERVVLGNRVGELAYETRSGEYLIEAFGG